MTLIMGICPKCGWFKCTKTCRYCNELMINTDTTVEDVMKMSDREEQEVINHYIETLIKGTYEPEIRKWREECEQNEKQDRTSRVRLLHCPSCGSINISDIGVFERAVSVGIFGLMSDKIGKTKQCNDCGTKW